MAVKPPTNPPTTKPRRMSTEGVLPCPGAGAYREVPTASSRVHPIKADQTQRIGLRFKDLSFNAKPSLALLELFSLRIACGHQVSDQVFQLFRIQRVDQPNWHLR